MKRQCKNTKETICFKKRLGQNIKKTKMWYDFKMQSKNKKNPFDFKTRNAFLVAQVSWHYSRTTFDMAVNI